MAKEMGYRPNSLMSEIAASRWQKAPVSKGSTLAFIDCSRRKGQIGHAKLGLATREYAASFGYNLEYLRRSDFINSGKLEKVLRNRGITDVIVGPAYEESLTVELDWENFICVQLLPSGMTPASLHSVIKNHYERVTLAWQQAVSHGYERIGITLVDHPVKLIDDFHRLSAVYACQKLFFPHLPAIEPYHFFDPGDDSELFMAWVKANEPDVVLGFSGGYNFVLRAKTKRKIGFIDLHKNDPGGFSGIPDMAEIYEREAVNLLHFCRRTHQWGIPKQRIDHVVEPVWYEGNSLPRKNQ